MKINNIIVPEPRNFAGSLGRYNLFWYFPMYWYFHRFLDLLRLVILINFDMNFPRNFQILITSATLFFFKQNAELPVVSVK